MNNTRKPNRRRFASLATIAALGAGILTGGSAPIAADAASGSASISGKVVVAASSSSAVGAAEISVNAKSTSGHVYSTRTTSSGTFSLTGLRAGTYSIKFSDRVGRVQCDGGCGSRRFYTTEWLGDATSFSAARKLTLSSGQHKTGIREVIGYTSSLTGTVTVNGAAPKKYDVIAYAVDLAGHRRHSSFVVGSRFGFALRPDNYRIKLVSRSHAFASFYITDPTDGNQVFHANGVGKQTGVRVDITTP